MSTHGSNTRARAGSSVLTPPMIQLSPTAYEQARANQEEAANRPARAPRRRRNAPQPGSYLDEQAGGRELAARMARAGGDEERARRYEAEARDFRAKADAARARAAERVANNGARAKSSGGKATRTTEQTATIRAVKQQMAIAQAQERQRAANRAEAGLARVPAAQRIYEPAVPAMRAEVARYQRGDFSAPQPRPEPTGRESLRARAQRLSLDAEQYRVWRDWAPHTPAERTAASHHYMTLYDRAGTAWSAVHAAEQAKQDAATVRAASRDPLYRAATAGRQITVAAKSDGTRFVLHATRASDGRYTVRTSLGGQTDLTRSTTVSAAQLARTLQSYDLITPSAPPRSSSRAKKSA